MASSHRLKIGSLVTLSSTVPYKTMSSFRTTFEEKLERLETGCIMAVMKIDELGRGTYFHVDLITSIGQISCTITAAGIILDHTSSARVWFLKEL